jgi:A/G-specific adenine glycosylase
MERQPAISMLQGLGPWFEARRRRLPWRAEDLDAPHGDPYGVLVSEVMLQQTQVATVVPYFERWMARFPTARSLAEAPEEEIHKAWEGLGYYRRARLLQAAARAVADHGWPRDLEGLLALPGLGPYTAAAVASIAFQLPEPALDGNAFRVLARILAMEADPRLSAPALRGWLRPALEAFGPGRTTQALMELGATHCGSRPRCPGCPLEGSCRARALGLQGRIPAPRPRTPVRDVHLRLLAVSSGDRWLVQAPRSRGLLAGLWQWPALPCPPDAEGAGDPGGGPCDDWIQAYTHRREHVHPAVLRLAEPLEPPPGTRWVDRAALAELPMGNRDARLRALVLAGATARPGPRPLLEALFR